MDLRSAVEQAYERFKDRILDPCGGVLIPDTEEELNWHAFLAHSLDMQGFRADWFVGRQPNPEWPAFRTLLERGIGVEQLGALWDVEPIRHALSRPREHGMTSVEPALALVESHGGETGQSLADAFRTARMRKNIMTIRGYLQNSHKLKEHGYSFRRYLQAVAAQLDPGTEFPPSDFMKPVLWKGQQVPLEGALAFHLEWDFYGVGPEIAPYMLCDWMLGLWREKKTGMFESFKWDSRNVVFFKPYGEQIQSKQDFLRWYRTQGFSHPVRVANEAIWLERESKGTS